MEALKRELEKSFGHATFKSDLQEEATVSIHKGRPARVRTSPLHFRNLRSAVSISPESRNTLSKMPLHVDHTYNTPKQTYRCSRCLRLHADGCGKVPLLPAPGSPLSWSHSRPLSPARPRRGPAHGAPLPWHPSRGPQLAYLTERAQENHGRPRQRPPPC